MVCPLRRGTTRPSRRISARFCETGLWSASIAPAISPTGRSPSMIRQRMRAVRVGQGFEKFAGAV